MLSCDMARERALQHVSCWRSIKWFLENKWPIRKLRAPIVSYYLPPKMKKGQLGRRIDRQTEKHRYNRVTIGSPPFTSCRRREQNTNRPPPPPEDEQKIKKTNNGWWLDWVIRSNKQDSRISHRPHDTLQRKGDGANHAFCCCE